MLAVLAAVAALVAALIVFLAAASQSVVIGLGLLALGLLSLHVAYPWTPWHRTA